MKKRKLTENQKMVLLCMVYLLIYSLVPFADAYAQGIHTGIDRGTNYIMTYLGPSLLALGFGILGCSLVFGNTQLASKGGFVLLGGILAVGAQKLMTQVVGFFR